MNRFCNELEFTTAINTLATAFAAKFETTEELTAAASILVQIGETMHSIAARRDVCEKDKKLSSNT